MRTMLKNLCLLLVSCAIGLSLCEVSLRLFYPRYRELAEAQFEKDALRVWARAPNSRGSHVHPDTRLSHSLLHNNFGLRQHRDFREADLAVAANIGFFGDSFTENVRMAAPYSFTEPLDYLLNLQPGRFNVLNFGVEGYGTDQSFLHYEHFRHAGDLDHVFYVYFDNDLTDIRASGLFHLDDERRLAQVEALEGSWWAPLVSRLHVTYLVLDAIGRTTFFAELAVKNKEYLDRRSRDRAANLSLDLSRFVAPSMDDRQSLDDRRISLEIFRQLIRRWKNLVEDNGGTFSIVFLPIPPQPFVADLIRTENIEVIDLNACFNDNDPAHSQTPWDVESSYRFKNDLHWNEAGNSLAAVCLYRALEEKMNLPVLSEDGLQEAVFRYYAAFGDEISQPIPRGTLHRHGRRFAEIREKYMELDLKYMELDLEVMKLARQPDKRIISSDLDVYLARDHLVYVKDNCRPTDVDAPFFLHVVPVDNGDLPFSRRQHGFDNIYVHHGPIIRINDRQCAIIEELPDYPIRYITTGQYVPGAGRLWEGGYSVEQAE